MKVLVVGSGGREHALVWKLAQSSKVSKIFCAPGNAGISELATNVDISAEDIEGLTNFALKEEIDLTVVGPEVSLTLGIVDSFQNKGLRIFGPDQKAAILEGSKVFTKDLMEKYAFKAADCVKVVSHVTTMAWVHCGADYEPAGIPAAQMNLLFGLASMLLYGDAFVDQYTEEAVRNPKTISFIRQHLETTPDKELDKLGPEGRHAAWIEVFLKDGRRLTQRAIQRKGSIENPMSREEVCRKFRKLTANVFPDKRIDSFEKMVIHLEQVKDIRELARLLVKEVKSIC